MVGEGNVSVHADDVELSPERYGTEFVARARGVGGIRQIATVDCPHCGDDRVPVRLIRRAAESLELATDYEDGKTLRLGDGCVVNNEGLIAGEPCRNIGGRKRTPPNSVV